MATTAYPTTSHPWHGISTFLAGDIVQFYIEATPFETLKYELDKPTGLLSIDRPLHSALPPYAYGFIPRTYCGEGVNALNPNSKTGDDDPLDAFLISEVPLTRSGVLARGRVVGGIPMVDDGEADDKLILVLKDDPAWGGAREVDELPAGIIDRIRHYLVTYKPGSTVDLGETYGSEHGMAVLKASVTDYLTTFTPVRS